MINKVKGSVGAVRQVRDQILTGLVMGWGEGWESKVTESLPKKVEGRLGFKGEETICQAKERGLKRAFQAGEAYVPCNSAQYF